MQVRVRGWMTPRSILEEDGKILFEVAETDGCTTCHSRIEHVRRALTRKNIPVSFRTMPSLYGSSCLYVELDPPSEEGADLKRHVGEILDLAIS